MSSATQKKMLYSGMPPLKLAKYRVLSYVDGTEQGIFTELYVNHPETGTLSPAQYRVIADKSNQGMKLSAYALRNVAAFMSEGKGGDNWISLYMPAKSLVYSHLKKILESEYKSESYGLSKLVFELPPEILYEDAGQVSQTIVRLNEEYGVRFLLGGYCDEYCPILRIQRFPFDFVLLDPTVNTPQMLKAVRGAINIAKQNGKAVIARINSPFSGLAADESPDFYIPEIPISERRGV